MSAAPLVSNALLVRSFECKICLQYALPPYFICPNGHFLCTLCIQNAHVTKCPTCRGAKPAIRNLVMEEIATHLHFPCRYEPMGCNSLSLLSQKEDHEDVCLHKVYFCPHRKASDCTWRGSVPALEEHMHDAHRVSAAEDLGNGVTQVTLPEAFVAGRVSPVTYLLKYDGLLFVAMVHCLSVSTSARRTYPRQLSHFSVTVQLAGPKFSAELYGYRVKCGNDHYLQTFEGPTTSIDVDVDELLLDDRCFHLPVKAVVHVVDRDNALPLAIDITRRG